jgi:hypothetical protein
MKQQVVVRTSVVTVLEPSCRPIPTILVQWPADPLKVETALQLLVAIVRSSLIATLAAEAATAEAPTTGLTGGPVEEAIAAAEATRIAMPPKPHRVLTVYFGTPSMFITLWFGFDYGTNPPLGTLII